MTLRSTLILAAGAAGLAACASTSPAPRAVGSTSVGAPSALYAAPLPAAGKEPVTHLEIFVEDVELGEVDIEVDGFPEFTTMDVERTRTGFRGSFGGRAAKGYVQLFGEEIKSAAVGGGDELDSYGLGGGVVGKPRIASFSDDAGLILPYRFGVNVVAGDANAIDLLIYGEAELEIGIGADVFGFQPAVGFYVQSFAGAFEQDLDDDDEDDDPDGDISASNSGGYVELYYRNADFPLYGRVRANFSDVDGALFTIGAAF